MNDPTQQRPPGAEEVRRLEVYVDSFDRLNIRPCRDGEYVEHDHYEALDAYTKRVEAERDAALAEIEHLRSVAWVEKCLELEGQVKAALAREQRLRELLRLCRYGAHPGSQLAADVEEALRHAD